MGIHWERFLGKGFLGIGKIAAHIPVGGELNHVLARCGGGETGERLPEIEIRAGRRTHQSAQAGQWQYANHRSRRCDLSRQIF